MRKNYFLIGLFIAALAIRLWGVKPGFPIYHPDENMSYSTAIYMLYHKLEPDRFDYPAGVPFLHFLIYKIFILPFIFLKLFFPHPRVFLTAIRLGDQFFHNMKIIIFGNSGIYALYWSRYIAAVVGALTIPLVYFTSKKLFNRRVALFTAFFLTFNYRHVLGSHFGLPDIHNAFFSLLSLFASALLLEKNTKGRYLFAGVTVALSFSIKYQTFSLSPFLLVHLIWTLRKRSISYLFYKDFIKALFIMPLIFIIINPYFFFNLGEVIKQNSYTALRYQVGILKLRFYPYFYLYHWGLGKLPSMAVFFGILSMLILAPQKLLVIFSFVLSFFFALTYYSAGGGYVRNFVTVIPTLMIFAGFFMELLYRVFKKVRFLSVGVLTAVLLIYFNFSSIKNSLTLSYYYSKPWHFIELGRWMERNMPEGIQLRTYPLYAPYERQEKNIKELDWSYSEGPNSLAEFQEEGTDFAIINSKKLQGVNYWWMNWSGQQLIKYNGLPYDYLLNNYYDLALYELLNYTVYEIYKPWQAAAAYNYLVFKIPAKPESLGEEITSFDFSKENHGWDIRGSLGFGKPGFFFDREEGKERRGSLRLDGGSGFDTSRLSSPPIAIKGGKYYTAYGWIKNSPVLEDIERDGFLRIDFYKGINPQELENIGMVAAISPRAWVRGEWVEEQVSMRAPPEASYLTISLQRKELNRGFSSYLDDVKLFESDLVPKEKFKEVPYIKPTIPKENLFYNSFL